VFFHGLAVLASSLSVIRGVATIEPVNRVIVPILLAIVAFSFYWAIFLPSAADGIRHLFRPNWGM
jgi:SNF family Na+-dependent transporter